MGKESELGNIGSKAGPTPSEGRGGKGRVEVS
jgi:hypothetical protein